MEIKKKLVFLTGAGVSAESGIPTFRDNGGLWDQFNVEDVASIQGYQRNPGMVIDFYNKFLKEVQTKEPNEAHKLIAFLEEKYDVTVITQNIDKLHEKAGSSFVIHLHGECDKATSSKDPNNPGCIVPYPIDGIMPGDKALDASPLRPFIVWFGEDVPELPRAIRYVMAADIFVIVGTSLNVYPAASLIEYYQPHKTAYIIDPADIYIEDRDFEICSVKHIKEKASIGMKELIKLLEK